MKIIEHGELTLRTDLKYLLTCPHCGCKFVFETNEIEKVEKCIDGNGWIHCPDCKCEIEFKRPEALRAWVESCNKDEDNDIVDSASLDSSENYADGENADIYAYTDFYEDTDENEHEDDYEPIKDIDYDEFADDTLSEEDKKMLSEMQPEFGHVLTDDEEDEDENVNDAKLHLELAPVTILNIDDENDGVEITLYDDTHNWDIHEYIMSQFKLTNLYTACSLPYSTSFEVEEEKTIRILHKVVIPVYEYSHDIVLRILNVIRMAEEYALKI